MPVKKAVKQRMSIPVYDISGKELRTVDLPKEIFNVKVNPRLLALYIRVYLANQRQGTASAKGRGEVSGSTRKIYRQKGTGRARHGSMKAPIFVGGGVVGGPKPRDYSLRLNKNQKRKALFYALTLKRKDIIGIESDKQLKPKTKTIATLLDNLKLTKENILLVLPKIEKSNLVLAARNIPTLKIIDAISLNAYVTINTDKIILTDSALSVLQAHHLKHGN